MATENGLEDQRRQSDHGQTEQPDSGDGEHVPGGDFTIQRNDGVTFTVDGSSATTVGDLAISPPARGTR